VTVDPADMSEAPPPTDGPWRTVEGARTLICVPSGQVRGRRPGKRLPPGMMLAAREPGSTHGGRGRGVRLSLHAEGRAARDGVALRAACRGRAMRSSCIAKAPPTTPGPAARPTPLGPGSHDRCPPPHFCTVVGKRNRATPGNQHDHRDWFTLGGGRLPRDTPRTIVRRCSRRLPGVGRRLCGVLPPLPTPDGARGRQAWPRARRSPLATVGEDGMIATAGVGAFPRHTPRTIKRRCGPRPPGVGRRLCGVLPPPPTPDGAGSRQAWPRTPARRGYAGVARRARYADQIRRHSVLDTAVPPACWRRYS
jgi:hypothetical protein